MIVLERILVPTNRGEPSQAAIRYGIEFARKFGAELFVVRVLSDLDFEVAIENERVLEKLMPEERSIDATDSDPDPKTVERFAALEDIGALVDPKDVEDIDIEFLIRRQGTRGAGEVIVECALDLSVEMIVIGKHRLGFVEHLLAGSVTEKVVRSAPCPVLIVHFPEREFVVAGG